jgi:pyruvate dehydrogenase E2 component (dihydrolipoamide acetyltransferase)
MTHTIIMPDLGQTTAEGKVLRWLKKPGEKVSRGEHLLEVETDKVTMEVEAYASGYLREILAEEGQMAGALLPIAIVTDDPNESYERPGTKAPAAISAPPSVSAASPSAEPRKEGFAAAPAARVLARELSLDLKSVTGSGPGGLITRQDVEQYASGRAAAKSTQAMAALVGLSKQTIPHFYLSADVDVAAAEQWRENWNADHPDLSASLNDLFVRAAARALRDVPGLNVAYREGKFETKARADVLLVAAVGSRLVLVPVADPGALPWDECLRELKEALERAREGRASAAHSRMTPWLAISNLGMYGVKQFTAIIPPSCTAVLAVGAVREQPVVRDGIVQVGQVASLTLSADHRVVDGITAAKFMGRIQEHLNNL